MRTSFLRNFILAALLTATTAFGQAPGMISYQGRVTVGGNSFTGTGLFKFAIIRTNGAAVTDWSNDGTSTAGGEPTAAVSLSVSAGLFSVNLGDAALANMTAIPASVFTNAELYLRIWFNDGTNGSARLSPDQRMVSAGYALRAASAASVDSVPAANVTGTLALNQLPGAVVTNNATAVTLTGAFTGNAAGLTNLSSLQLTGPLTLGIGDPVRVGGYDTAGNSRGVVVTNNYAYVADDSAGLQVINVSNPASPQRVGSYAPPGYAYGVAVAGNYAYVADYGAGLQVIDISNPANPQLVGGYHTADYASGVAVAGNYAYVAASSAGLQVIDISNPANPQRVGGYNTTGNAMGVAVAGNYAYVADEAAGLQVIDISNPANPQRVGGYDTTGYTVALAVAGNYAYLADTTAGLQVIDISNPANPQRVGGYDTAGAAFGVAVSGSYAYVADGSAGLLVIDVSKPANPQRVGGCDTAGSAAAVAVTGDYAYVADSAAGLQVLTAGSVATMSGIVQANLFSGDAAGLTNLNALQLTGGTLSDARLSANVALLNTNQAFTASNRFAGVVTAMNAANTFAGTFIGNGAALTNVVPASGSVTSASLASNLTVAGTLNAGSFQGNGALPWQSVAGTTQTAAGNTGYLLANAAQTTVTLPDSANVGDLVQVSGVGTGGWQVAGQVIGGSPGGSWIARANYQTWQAVASSADGTKWVAVVWNGQIYTSTNSGVTWTARESNRYWSSVASSADGTKLVAVVKGGQIYTSTDSGATWTARESSRDWGAVASSADGAKLVATVPGGQIYTSTDSGATWTARESSRDWGAVASSADGTKLVSVMGYGQIYTSTDSGVTWTARAGDQPWKSVASSADGTKLVAVVEAGQIYVSTNSGVTWAAQEFARNWWCVASSSDGAMVVAAVAGGQIYTAASVLTGTAGTTATFQYIGAGQWQPLRESQVAVGVVGSSQLAPNLTVSGTLTASIFTGNGSGLTNLDATDLTGTVPDARLSANVALLNANQVFTASNRFAGVVTATNVANTFAGAFTGNGGGLTNLSVNATNLSGTVADARLSTNVALLNTNQAFTASNRFAGVVTMTNAANTVAGAFTGNGAGLTNLSVANLTGTMADARLSTNVALLNANQSFTGTNFFWQPVGIGTANPGQLLQVGDANTPGSRGMIRFGSRAPTNAAYRTWDIGVPQHGGDTTGENYSFVIDDTLFGTGPEVVVQYGTGRVGIGRTNPATALDVNGTVTATTFAGNASGLTNLDAADLSGTVPDARLSTNVALVNGNQAFTSSNRFAGVVTSTNTASTFVGAFAGGFTGNGGGLTNLDAADLTGSLADARLSANVALLSANQAFAGSNRFTGAVTATNGANSLAGTFSGTGAGTFTGTFTGNGGGLTNLVSSGDYVFSYSTATQDVAVVGTFQDITCNVDAQMDGWTHTAGTATFTCGQSGLYWVQYKGQVQFSEASSAQMVSLRAVLGAAEIAGSDAAVYGKKPAATSADDIVTPVSTSFIASFTAGNVLKFQITGASGSGLQPNTGYSTTRPSFSCTIMRLR